VTGTCVSCHNGTTATGKPANHITTDNVCENCHTTTNWTSAVVDHADVSGTCSSCHNGTTATGKPANHIITTAECSDCHSTLAWTPASFDHSQASGPCASCHNGTIATGMPATHFVTTRNCDDCHVTTAWTPVHYTHVSPDFPGPHNASVTCARCHTTNTETATWTYVAYKPNCAGCHANRYTPDPHTKYGSVKYTVSELRDCSGACHIYTDATLTTIKTHRTGHHHSSDSSFSN
jgi:hypothetical protein